jgi:hypothetical protein
MVDPMHLLRNPWGHSEEDVRKARSWAADRIEELERKLAAAQATAQQVEDTPRYRPLTNQDIIRADDEFIGDDCVTWFKPVGWEIGARYSRAFKDARRRIDEPQSAKEGKS